MPTRQISFTIAIAALMFSFAGTVLAASWNAAEIKALQQVLRQCGFDPGPPDGSWGTETARAAADYIRAHGGHPLSGNEYVLINQAQDYIISAGSPCPKTAAQRQDTKHRARQAQDGQISEIQRVLAQCGFDPGPVDGVWGTKTAKAAEAYILAHGGAGEDPIAQADSYRKGPQPCPMPGTEVWDCSTFLERVVSGRTSGIILVADHDTGKGMVRMGSLPTIETLFLVEGLDRAWIWRGSASEQYQFVIGPRGDLGLVGHYFEFPASNEGEMVESQAAYSCEQAHG